MSTKAEITFKWKSEILGINGAANIVMTSDGHPSVVFEEIIFPLIYAKRKGNLKDDGLVPAILLSWGYEVVPAEYSWGYGDYVYTVDFIRETVVVEKIREKKEFSFEDFMTKKICELAEEAA